MPEPFLRLPREHSRLHGKGGGDVSPYLGDLALREALRQATRSPETLRNLLIVRRPPGKFSGPMDAGVSRRWPLWKDP